MWLKVTRSNNNSVLPALYYLEAALKLCPTLLQTDCGTDTENNITA